MDRIASAQITDAAREPRRRSVVIMGPQGSGKSALLKSLQSYVSDETGVFVPAAANLGTDRKCSHPKPAGPPLQLSGRHIHTASLQPTRSPGFGVTVLTGGWRYWQTVWKRFDVLNDADVVVIVLRTAGLAEAALRDELKRLTFALRTISKTPTVGCIVIRNGSSGDNPHFQSVITSSNPRVCIPRTAVCSVKDPELKMLIEFCGNVVATASGYSLPGDDIPDGFNRSDSTLPFSAYRHCSRSTAGSVDVHDRGCRCAVVRVSTRTGCPCLAVYCCDVRDGARTAPSVLSQIRSASLSWTHSEKERLALEEVGLSNDLGPPASGVAPRRVEPRIGHDTLGPGLMPSVGIEFKLPDPALKPHIDHLFVPLVIAVFPAVLAILGAFDAVVSVVAAINSTEDTPAAGSDEFLAVAILLSLSASLLALPALFMLPFLVTLNVRSDRAASTVRYATIASLGLWFLFGFITSYWVVVSLLPSAESSFEIVFADLTTTLLARLVCIAFRTAVHLRGGGTGIGPEAAFRDRSLAPPPRLAHFASSRAAGAASTLTVQSSTLMEPLLHNVV